MNNRSSQLGLGSYVYRWSIGIGDRQPEVPMSAFDVVEQAESLGLTLVQFADNLPLHLLDDAALDSLAAKASEAGITLEVGQQGSDMALLNQYLNIASRLDARIVRLALDAADAEKDQALLVGGFRAALPKAEASGVTLAIENHFGFLSARLAELVDAVDSDRLGVCLDVANSICAGEWPEQTIDLLAPYAVSLHLKDYDILPDQYGAGFRIVGTPLGEGRTDIPWTLEQVARSGREVNVILEHWLPGEGASLEQLAVLERDWIARSVAVARQFVAG